MAKKKPLTDADIAELQNSAILAAALKRAAEAEKVGVDIKPGVYTVDYKLRISGDITVGARTTASGNDFTGDELIGALLCTADSAAMKKALRSALNRLVKAKVNGDAPMAKKIDSAAGTAKAFVKANVEGMGLTKVTNRAGSITGKPLVEVTSGTITDGTITTE